MELKKNPKLDLDKKSPLFFTIGLVTALACVISAFEWKGQYEPKDIRVNNEVFEEPPIIPNTVIPPPKPPKPIDVVKTETVKEAYTVIESDDVKKIIDNLPSVDEPVDFPDIILPPLDPEDTKVYEGVVESAPEFPGGIEAFYAYLSKNIEYPKRAKTVDLTGKVFVQFIIDKDGKLIEVKAVKGIGGGCDEEAVRVIENSPLWQPAKNRGKPVKFRMVIPIIFSLN